MIKLIQSDTIESLETQTLNWIDSKTSDNREINIISSQVIVINKMSEIRINGGQPKVETVFNNWIVFNFKYL